MQPHQGALRSEQKPVQTIHEQSHRGVRNSNKPLLHRCIAILIWPRVNSEAHAHHALCCNLKWTQSWKLVHVRVWHHQPSSSWDNNHYEKYVRNLFHWHCPYLGMCRLWVTWHHKGRSQSAVGCETKGGWTCLGLSHGVSTLCNNNNKEQTCFGWYYWFFFLIGLTDFYLEKKI